MCHTLPLYDISILDENWRLLTDQSDHSICYNYNNSEVMYEKHCRWHIFNPKV